jgi:hypothetical protein
MEWIGTNVKVILKDGYTKYGLLLKQDTNFIEIQYQNSKGQEQIAISEIASIKLVSG